MDIKEHCKQKQILHKYPEGWANIMLLGQVFTFCDLDLLYK